MNKEKVILEMDAPKSCFKCDFSYQKDWLISYQVWCSLKRCCVHDYSDTRAEFCPLKIATKAICPRCENEEIAPDAKFCKICGLQLIRDNE